MQGSETHNRPYKSEQIFVPDVAPEPPILPSVTCGSITMPQEIVGSLPIKHQVDANGSLTLKIPVKVPPSKFAPTVSFAYHSAAKDYDVLGMGWALKSNFVIERVPATVSQDGFRGTFFLHIIRPALTLWARFH